MAIDVHGHLTSPELFRRYPMPPSLADVEGMLEAKAAAGITTTVVGSPVGAGTMVKTPGVDNYRQPAGDLERFHDWLGEQVRAHPGSLRAYAYVNPLGGDAEWERAAKRLEQPEFVGLIVNSSVQGRFLDGPEADGFFAMAAHHGAPVMLHPPAEPAGGAALDDLRLVEQIARPADVTTGTAAVLFAGWLRKYPALRIIAPVCGGGLPLLLERLERARRMPPGFGGGPPGNTGQAPAPADPPPPLADELRRVHVDTATPSRRALAAAVDAFGVHNVLFGTDTPPMSAPLPESLHRLDQLGLPEEHLELIRAGNARRIFDLPQAAPAGGAAEHRIAQEVRR
ncbi:amidohydrolase family protein [Streptomyces xiaopingdaonensis]|uniref:amidohydrolase family protein n=1 Tax=Streptomyces xiaopingdaonensis TaxID=1565415 RepID=UPI000316F3E9|nr:amidohydrolase family protein [Streptomyces xiaopingdaonensis]